MTAVDMALVDELEEFVRRGALWDRPQLTELIARLEADTEGTGDPIPAMLGQTLRSVLLRMQLGPVPRRIACDVDGIVYPRVWKIMEAIRDGMPEGERRVRIEVFNRRLARCFAQEPVDPGGLDEAGA
jgi:hypothetical protein